MPGAGRRGALLLEHFERTVGPWGGAGVMAPEWRHDFSILRFSDRPRSGVTTTVTFGISAHTLTGRDASKRRQEALMLLRDEDAALEICANLGAYMLAEHVALLEGETIAMPFEGATSLDRLVVVPPDPPYPDLARFGNRRSPVEVVRVLPFATREHHVIAEHGWLDLMRWLDEYGYDPYDLGRPTIL